MPHTQPNGWRTLACLVTFILLACGAANSADLKKKVLIIGIDGCRADALLAADAPNLQALIEKGAFTDRAQTGSDTVSGPGWSSMLTGVWADKHGVHNNEFMGSHYDDYPHFFRRVKEVNPQLVTQSVVHWAPIKEKIVSAADVSIAPPTDDEVATEACRLLKETNPDVLFLHFDDVDSAGHAHGFHPEVAQYMAAIHKVDEQVGQVLEALAARPTRDQEDWLILSSTDHGGRGRGHSGGANVPEIRTIFFLANGAAVEPGKIEMPVGIVDVAVTAAYHLGVKANPDWKWDGQPVGFKP